MPTPYHVPARLQSCPSGQGATSPFGINDWSATGAALPRLAGTGHDRYASLVIDGGARGPQRDLADPVVVAAQQQVNRVRTAGGITTITIGLAGQQQAR